MRSSFISAIVAGSLLVSTTAAAARQPGALPQRSGADVQNPEQLGGGLLALVGLLALLLLIGGFVLLDDNDDEDLPHSP